MDKVIGGGIIDFPIAKVLEIKGYLDRLDALVLEYIYTSDPLSLESLKRKLIGELSSFAELYAFVRSYKSGTHSYVEEERKSLKARCIKNMTEVSHTKAAELVYDSEAYKAGIRKVEDIRAYFLKVEMKYDIYTRTLDAIIQSTSIAYKEKSQSNFG